MNDHNSLTLAGRCACGAVAFHINASTYRPIVECHCHTCRRTSGHVWAAMAVRLPELTLDSDYGLKWFDSSSHASRGFCGECGASLFFQKEGSQEISIAAGALDSPTGLTCSEAICCDQASDYYTINPELTQRHEATAQSQWHR